MKSTIDKLDGLARKINVTLSMEEVNSEFSKAYTAIRAEANIKGFRKGKAPLEKIKSEYGTRVKRDVLDRIINNSYFDALDEHQEIPVSEPKINFSQFDENQEFSYTAEFEVRPQIEINKYEGIEIEKNKVEVSEKDIEDSLKKIQESNVKHETIFEDRPAKEGDIAVINFDGYVDGEPLQGGKAEKHPLKLGSQSFIAGFEDGIYGMKLNDEKTLNLNFPEDYHQKEIAAKPVEFKVKLVELKKEVLPELNDEFAKSLGQFESLEQLKETIEKELKQAQENESQDKLKKALMNKLLTENPFDAPRTLIEQQKLNLHQDMKQKLQQQGMPETDFEDYKTKWDKDFEETATFMVKSSFMIDELAKKLDIKIDKSDYDEQFQKISMSTGLPLETITNFYSEKERRNQIYFQILEEKVVSTVLEKSNIKEI